MEKSKKKIYGKILLIFFLVIAVCSILSRAADSLTIPKVTVQRAESGRISYRLDGSGTVEAVTKSTHLIPAGFLVESCIEDGSSVEVGDVLIQFQMEQLKNRRQELATALQQAQLQLEQAKLGQNEAALLPDEEEARKTLALAQAGYTVESARLEVATAEKNLREADELIAQDGKICAKEKGIFQNTAVKVGSVTTGSEFISIGTGGLTFTAEIPKEAGEKLAEGDAISIKIPGQKKIETVITQMISGKKQEEGEEKEAVFLKVMLPEDTEIFSGHASFSVAKDSEEEYQKILPLTAIRQDSRGYYCLGIRTEDSILGEEVRAERINITLLDKDDTQAAVEGAMQADTKIIVTGEKDVLAGDRVRIEE